MLRGHWESSGIPFNSFGLDFPSVTLTDYTYMWICKFQKTCSYRNLGKHSKYSWFRVGIEIAWILLYGLFASIWSTSDHVYLLWLLIISMFALVCALLVTHPKYAAHRFIFFSCENVYWYKRHTKVFEGSL